MTGRSCGICGEATADARYCGHCGAPLDATVVSLDTEPGTGNATDPSPSGSDAHVVTSRRPSRLLVGAVVALLAIGAVALVAADRGDDDAAPLARPTPDGTLRNDAPRPVPSATPTERPAATLRPSPTAVATPAPVDPGDLPPMEATHVAVIGERTVEFLDLRSGIWAVPPGRAAYQPYGAQAVRGGVVLQTDDGSWGFAPVDGGPVTELAAEAFGFALVGDELLVTLTQNFWASDADVNGGDAVGDLAAHRFDGTVAWTAPLPTGAWPVGVTGDGQVILQLAERIVALDGATGTPRVVATGDIVTTFDDSVVLWSCDEQLRCATRQLDLATGATTVLSERQVWLEPAGQDRFVGYPQAGGEPQRFAVVDGVLTEVEDDGSMSDVQTNPGRFAADASGVTVELGRDTIRFTTPDGDVTTIVAPPAAGPTATLLLVTAD
ncbi:MAG: hypothetical protein ACE367_05510 [Acidimicrobiales bacterium]